MIPVFISLCIIFTLVLPSPASNGASTHKWFEEKNFYQLKRLNNGQMLELAKRSSNPSFEFLLDPILLPRVVGTENHAKVRKYLIDKMEGLGWTVEVDSFTDTTPFGRKKFANVIATLNPKAQRRLVLACHYDSKYSREDIFIGATDSAVPCAMMLDLAIVLQKELKKHADVDGDPTLQFIFFDGEEAFRVWESADSIYGSRHLAKKWEDTPYPEGNHNGTNYLNRIDMLVLLDLLGAPNPRFYSFFPKTEVFYHRMVEIEMELSSLSVLTSKQGRYFQPKSTYAVIEDDHTPFLQKDVPILHLIPVPFPLVWHKFEDNKNALDFPTIDHLNKIVRIFVAEYLRIND